MKQLKRFFCLTLYILLHLSTYAQQGARKAVFIIVDGIPADVVEKVATPHLDSIAAVGGYTRAYVGGEKGAYSQTPTISAVGYNSLLTGTWVNKHNVWDNDIAAQNYHYWSLFRYFKQAHPQKKTAIFSTWLDNRTKLVGHGLPQTGYLHIDHHVDGLEKDTARYPHDRNSWYIHLIDEEVVNQAAAYIRDSAPDLSWVYLEYTDDMGHRYGDSDKMYGAVKMADDQVGRIWNAVQHRMRQYGEDWQIFITTDHGRDSSSGRHHGGQSDRERTTWIVTNARDLNARFTKGQPGVVDIMPGIARFLQVPLPLENAREVDGVPLTGPVSLAEPGARYENGELLLQWKALSKQGMVRVWIADTNHFKAGGTDQYRLLTEVPLQQEQAAVKIARPSSGFYKVVLEGPDNMVNRWVTF
ncbi:alkaline phosphatase family protein [Chitinophaga japonensis]|uniref:Type I phosphodiesterase/nucleotide pyrophosphatase n=1 Tax=Chitinophaga japonensis TaxID=104662 RepID=A0A562TB95_CHIJA|nr:alkaline phosphatase family protein [Chitinophaga japonensis]TWI90835.1 type I phosphodiesterase/nucleotide pyrophosphatase [Chitinophaga japonensis]